MIDWIKHGIEKVVPQPEIHVRSKTEGNEKAEAPAPAKGIFTSYSATNPHHRPIKLREMVFHVVVVNV